MGILRDFVTVVKSECVLNSYYFSFYDVPDLIIKKKYSRKDYDLIISILNKVKKAYLVQKAQIVNQEHKVAQLEITDEDLVPLELFD